MPINITGAFDGHGLILQFSPTANLVGGGMFDEFEFNEIEIRPADNSISKVSITSDLYTMYSQAE